MCGIAGVLDGQAATGRDALAAVAERMGASLRHRGPDDGAIWVDEAAGIALAHRRLSIIDLSAAGRQPMVSRAGRYVLVWNGELYNFRDLRGRLESNGAQFRGHSDTEVMLAAIEAWGLERALVRANGMFAFAVWDREDRRLRLARDRVGEKPLYYASTGSTFLFGSELRALREHPSCPSGVDRDALTALLRYGYIPEPWSILRGVRKLPPGTFLEVDPNDRSLRPPTPYWQAEDVVARALAAPRLSGVEAVDATHRALSDAVRIRLESDVPLGALLSGGIDSSLVVALMQEHSSTPVRTFTIGSSDRANDEAPEAKAVARALGTDHTEMYVEPAEARAIVTELPAIYDEPLADPSQLPSVVVARLARRAVTVVLSGDGGDELFGGYNRYVLGDAVWRRARHVPAAVRRPIGSALSRIPPESSDRLYRRVEHLMPRAARVRLPGDKLQKLGDVIAAPDLDALCRALVSQWHDPTEVVIGGVEPHVAFADPSSGPSLPDTVDRLMYRDLLGYLPGDALVKLDRATMSVALEGRLPFLDDRVVETAWSLDRSAKIRDGQGKWALRRVLDRYLPSELVDRPKMGFDLPLDGWLRSDLREWAEALLEPKRLAAEGYFRPEPVRKLLDGHVRGRRNDAYRLWPLLAFQAWLESERTRPAAPA